MELKEAIFITQRFILSEIRCEIENDRMAELNEIIRKSKEALELVLSAAEKWDAQEWYIELPRPDNYRWFKWMQDNGYAETTAESIVAAYRKAWRT
jgi:hypothetical protein